MKWLRHATILAMAAALALVTGVGWSIWEKVAVLAGVPLMLCLNELVLSRRGRRHQGAGGRRLTSTEARLLHEYREPR
jgi:hypothetical protein